MERVNEQHPRTDLLGRGERSDHRVAKQERAEPASLHARVDRQPSEQDGGDGMPGLAAPRTERRVRGRDGRGRERVVADDALLIGVDHDVRARGAATSSLGCVLE